MTTTAKPEYKVIGTRPIRHDGVDKVIGRAQYGADIRMPGMLHGKVLRSPHPHARIISIDTSKAEAHPEVRAVATSADPARPGPREPGQHIPERGIGQHIGSGEGAVQRSLGGGGGGNDCAGRRRGTGPDCR